MLELVDLHKSYGRKSILRGISLHIEEPGIHAVLGPNGSGKTTIMKSILGMVLPNSGSVLFNNKNIANDINYRSEIDYVPQIANFPQNIKVDEMYDLIEKIRSKEGVRRNDLIELFLLEKHLDKRIGALSGGTLQKLNLSLALMFDSPLLILDEPTTGLDPIALIALKDFLIAEKQNGKIILLTTHIMNFVEEMADTVTFLLDGKIYYNGSTKALKASYGDQDMEHIIAKILKDHA